MQDVFDIACMEFGPELSSCFWRCILFVDKPSFCLLQANDGNNGRGYHQPFTSNVTGQHILWSLSIIIPLICTWR